MVQLEHYYQLIERDTSTVPSLWKVSHLVALAIAAISGFGTAYSLGKVLDGFGDHCILGARLQFTDRNTTTSEMDEYELLKLSHLPENLKPLDLIHSEWGSMSLCNYCQFTPMMSMIFGIIWGTFFMMCGKGGGGYATDVTIIISSVYRPWRIIYPALIFAAIFTIAVAVSTIQVNKGISSFCAEFETVLGTTKCTREIDEYTLYFHDRKTNVSIALKTLAPCAYICLFAWVAQISLLVLRVACVVDFQLLEISITDKQDEVVQFVIEPDNLPQNVIEEVAFDPKNKPDVAASYV